MLRKKDDFYDVCCSKVPETEVVLLVGKEEEHFVGVPNLQVTLQLELSCILINAGMLIVIH